MLNATVNKKGVPILKVCIVHPLKKECSLNPKYKMKKMVDAKMPL